MNGGFEYNLDLLAIAFAVTAIGAGSWSLDNILGLDADGAGWALAAGLAGAIGAVAAGNRPPARASAGRATPSSA